MLRTSILLLAGALLAGCAGSPGRLETLVAEKPVLAHAGPAAPAAPLPAAVVRAGCDEGG